MTPLLFAVSLSAVLSSASLLVILFRVSPITAPAFALPFLFLTLFLALSSVGALSFYGLWHLIPIEGHDAGRRLTTALREGIFLGTSVSLLLLFHLLGIFTWWIALPLVGVFVLIEVALHV